MLLILKNIAKLETKLKKKIVRSCKDTEEYFWFHLLHVITSFILASLEAHDIVQIRMFFIFKVNITLMSHVCPWLNIPNTSLTDGSTWKCQLRVEDYLHLSLICTCSIVIEWCGLNSRRGQNFFKDLMRCIKYYSVH